MSKTSLEELFLLVKNSNEEAFDELYHRTWQKLYEIAFRRLRDADTAKEIIQDLYNRIMGKTRAKSNSGRRPLPLPGRSF